MDATTVKYPEAISRHFGVWEGNAIYVTLDGEVVDRHSTRLEIGARGNKYSQRNTYKWSDGREQVYDFPGYFDADGKLIIRSERLEGECVVVDKDVIMFKAGYKGGMAEVSVYDLIRVCSDEKTRCRTWQMFKEGMPWKIVNVVERHTNEDDVYIEMGTA